jgi:hypothetical protein
VPAILSHQQAPQSVYAHNDLERAAIICFARSVGPACFGLLAQPLSSHELQYRLLVVPCTSSLAFLSLFWLCYVVGSVQIRRSVLPFRPSRASLLCFPRVGASQLCLCWLVLAWCTRCFRCTLQCQTACSTYRWKLVQQLSKVHWYRKRPESPQLGLQDLSKGPSMG